MPNRLPTSPPRRAFLRRVGALGLGAPLLGAVPAPDLGTDALYDRVLRGMCVQTPTIFPGPFYLSGAQLRRDLVGDRQGLPLTLFFKVVRAADCTPIENATVDVWHVDAAGRYSGIAALGTTGSNWLRGVQATDATGVASFTTVFPGWFPSRTTHLHLVVRDGNRFVVTQTFFPDSLPDLVYDLLPPYTARGRRDTTNDPDSGYVRSNEKAVLAAPDGSFGLWAGLVIGLA